MKYPKGTPTHMCAPQQYRHTPNITGSYELDSVISANKNKDMSQRLGFYGGDMRGFGGHTEKSYGPRTAYNGYDGMSGDE